MDERRNCPSSSFADTIEKCGAAFLLSKQVEDIPDDKYSASGDDIHEALALRKDPHTLSAPDLETYGMCKQDVMARFEEWRRDLPEELRQPIQLHRERRLFLRRGIRPIWTCRSDIAAIAGGKYLFLADYKTGRKDVPVAATNLQLRTGLAAWKQEYPELLAARVHIIQPWVRRGPNSSQYIGMDMDVAITETIALSDKAVTKGQPEVTGPHCHFCRGKSICTSFQALMKRDAEISPLEGLSDDQLSSLLLRIPLYNRLAKEVISLAKLRKRTNPNSMPDWVLSPTGPSGKVTDVSEAWKRLESDLTPSEFIGCATVGKTKLRDAISNKRNITQKAASSYLNEKLIGIVDDREKSPKLKFIGQSAEVIELE